jgi:hypothetical protein
MKSKLTLTIEESVKDRAKKFAKRHDTSVSDMVEKFLHIVTQEEGWYSEPGSVTESLMGSVELPKELEGMDYKQIKRKILLEKYAK